MTATRVCVAGCVICLVLGVIAVFVPLLAGPTAFGVLAIAFAQASKIAW